MKRIAWFTFFIAMLPFLAMCRKPVNVAPVSKICRYDGAESGTMVKVICTGIGDSQETAFIDAKKAATWFVLSKLLRTSYERQRFGMIEQAFYRRYNTFLNKATTDGTYTQGDDGNAHVEAKISVNREAIVAFLKDKGIINPDQLREAVGNPTVAVVSKWKTRDPRWEAQIQSAASEFLTSRSYNTIDLSSGMKKLNKFTQALLKSENLPIDKKFRASLAMGADVYLEVSAWNQNKGASTKGAARVKAYETTTGRLLGDASAFGKEYPRDNQREFQTVKEAVQNATEKTLTALMTYWRKDAVQGNRYFIVLAGKLDAVEDMGDLLSLRIQKIPGVRNFKRITMTAQRMTITLQSKANQVEMSLNLKQTLRKAPGVQDLKLPIATRKFFLFVINSQQKISSDSDQLPPGL